MDSDIRERLASALRHRYELGDEVGRGGMAIVFRATDLRHGRNVALKVLRPDVALSVGADRFLNEVRLIARLAHPHIVPLHDSGDANGLLYYVMPFVEGESLRDRITREGTLPVADAVRIAREVADALSHAHAQDVVHRDIKPENILLVAGHAVVSDFGIARAISAASGVGVTGTGVVIGTRLYMSPEQMIGQMRLDGRSDIYSVGCVLFEMLAGHPPGAGPARPRSISGGAPGAVTALGRARPAIPRHVLQALRTALAADPERRFPTAAAFAASLSDSPTMREAMRRLVPQGRAAVLAGVLVVGLGAAFFLRGRPPRTLLDSRRVLVVAFTASDTLGALAVQSTDAMLAVLDGTGYFTGLDARRYSRLGEARATSPDSARRLAERLRAAYYLEAKLVDGDSIRLVLNLRFTGTDSMVPRVMTFARITSAWTIGVQATSELLPVLTGTKVNLDAVRNRNPAAAVAFLTGERFYRAAQFDSAFAQYREAVRIDSSFAQAALKGAQAASWKLRTADARQFIAVALADSAALGADERLIARGLDAYLDARGDSAMRILRDAVAHKEYSPETWMALGEVYTHLLPRAGPADSLAKDAFEHVNRLDPEFMPVMIHLFEIAAREGNVPRARAMLDRMRSARADSAELYSADVMLDCVARSPSRVDWRALAVRHWVEPIIEAARLLTVGGLRQPMCAEALWRAALEHAATPSQRWGAIQGVQNVLVAQGRFAEVDTLFQRDTVTNPGLKQRMFMLDEEASQQEALHAQAAVGATKLRNGFASGTSTMGATSLWYLGMYEAAHGRLANARIVRDTLAARVKRSESSTVRRLAASLDARTALAGLDTNRAIALLTALSPDAGKDSLEWDAFESHGSDRMLLAHILFARHKYATAREYASLIDSPAPVWYAIYVPESLRLRVKIAEELGDDRAAESMRLRLRSLGREDLVKRGR